MSKELEALGRIKAFYPQWHLYNRNDFLIIETKLKKLEKADNCIFTSRYDVKKEHQALEIIKEKGLHYLEIASIQGNCSYEKYLMECNRTVDIGLISRPLFDCKPKTKEEFDLLKEVLK